MDMTMPMPDWVVPLLGALCMMALISPAADAAEKSHRVGVVVGPHAPELTRFAADELCGYLRKLFGIRAKPTTTVPVAADALFLIGSPETNPTVKQACARRPFPKVSDQGIILRRQQFQGQSALLVAGGSPRATLWAIYELAERWGVRYLLHGDVLPPRQPFRIPNLSVVMEPALRVRQWRVINDFACGPESWGMADYRPVLDQLAKLKFNRIFLSVYPWQPFLHLEVRGIKRQRAWLWYDFHYPITDDMPGYHLFVPPSRDSALRAYARPYRRTPHSEIGREFWNPDLPLKASYAEFVAGGERLVHNLMAYAHARGMECVLVATLTEFPPEFAPLLKNAQKVHQLAELTVVPSGDADVDDPGLTELASAVLQATIGTYPEADFIALGMPEFRQWAGQYERAWQSLDAKFGIGNAAKLTDVIAAAERRTGYPGGADRAVQEVKGDIVALYFYDRLITAERSRGSFPKVIMNSVAEELFPILSRILSAGSETLNFVDYTPSRIVRRRHVLKNVPSRRIPASLIYTLHDDNVGVLPQLTTGSLHELTKDLSLYGWAGFSTRYWLIGDHDPCVAYLSKASWDKTATPESVYRDQIRAACGEASVEDMLTVFQEVEATTVQLEWHGLGLTFPVPGMMMKHWEPGPMPTELLEDRRSYQRALDAAHRARSKAKKAGRGYVDYWIGRLAFAVGYLDTVEAVRHAATAEAEEKPAESLQYAKAALAAARRALEAYARVARDQSDRGAIAVMNEYVYRPLKAKVEEIGMR